MQLLQYSKKNPEFVLFRFQSCGQGYLYYTFQLRSESLDKEEGGGEEQRKGKREGKKNYMDEGNKSNVAWQYN